jgi:hypothetical protein
MYSVTYSDEALKPIAKFKKSNQQAYKRVLKLVEELHAHPLIGTGKPKILKGMGGNVFSREINKKDRLVYEVYEEAVVVYVISAEGHYSDK